MKTGKALSLGLFLVLCAASFGQQSASGLPTFRAHTELVTVPVVVTEGGKHVVGLKKEDFAISEDGKPKPVAFFEEVTADNRLIPPALPPGTFSNQFISADSRAHLAVIVLDLLNASYFAQGDSRDKLIDFLQQPDPSGTPLMLATITADGLQVLARFTSNRTDLLAKLRQIRPSNDLGRMSGPYSAAREQTSRSNRIQDSNQPPPPPMGVRQPPSTTETVTNFVVSSTERRMEITLDAVEQLVRSLSGIQGRKALLWTSGGFVCEPAQPSSWRGLRPSLLDRCNNVWHLFSAENIAVYPIRSEQTSNPAYREPSAGEPAPFSLPDLGMGVYFAEHTGGKVCTFRSDASCYADAISDSAHYYMLSYYASETPKPTWRKIAVHVNRGGMTVRARNGYVTAGKSRDSEKARKDEVALAVVSPLDYTGLPLTLRWIRAADRNGKLALAFQIVVGPGALQVDESDQNHLKVDIIGYAFDDHGNKVGDFTKDLEARLKDRGYEIIRRDGLVFTDALEVPAGRYHVRFVVRDALTGKMGTVTAETPNPAPST